MVLNSNKLKSPSLKDDLCKVWLILAQCLWRRRFLKFVNVFFAISWLLPLGKGSGPSFEQTWIPFTQGCFVSSLVEFGPAVLEKKIFKSCQCNFTILQLPLFGKRNGPSFEQTWIPFIQRCIVPSLIKIGPVVLEKKSKIGNFYR